MAELKPPDDDGRVTREVGPWSKDKHWYLQRYIDIFTMGMKNNWQLHYVDLFAGAGIEDVKTHGLEWGSPLIAAQAREPFWRLHLCDLNKGYYDALKYRIQKFPQPQEPQLLHGDANECVMQVCAAIPPRGTLTLAFLDPCGLHLYFDTIRELAKNGRNVDFIIFFPDQLDILRNFRLYLKDPESNLDRVLGGADWRSIQKMHTDRWAEELRKLYEKQIRTLRYEYFGYKRISLPNGSPLYQLIFCSRHPLGLKFWNSIAEIDRRGQRSFF